jgi:hypothetical protein
VLVVIIGGLVVVLVLGIVRHVGFELGIVGRPATPKNVGCGASFVVQSSEVCFVYLVLRPGHVHDPVLFASVVTSELERTASYGRGFG